MSNSIIKTQPKHEIIIPDQEYNEKNITLYLLEDDKIYAESLTLQLEQYGFKCSLFTNTLDFYTAIKQNKPSIILSDIMMTDDQFGGTKVISQLKQEVGLSSPIVVFSQRSDFETKLEAVRANADTYLVKPIEVDSLLTILDNLVPKHYLHEDYRILIIDDDLQLANHYALVLQKAGMQASVINEPNLVGDAIIEFNPDIILMDLYMPECNGIELARLVRYHPEYLHIPIVFLSTETQLTQQLNALRMGGDDFLTKPIEDHYLSECLAIRAARARSLNELMIKDSMTGLFKHSIIKERLKSEMERTKRNHSKLTFAMIDLDHFKKINDTYGHLMGDNVIKRLARLLKVRMRNSDIIGRYGGEEFSVILPECGAEQAKEIFDELRRVFGEMTYNIEGEKFTVTCSIGISEFCDNITMEEFINQADQALYKVKESGRNRVVIYQQS